MGEAQEFMYYYISYVYIMLHLLHYITIYLFHDKSVNWNFSKENASQINIKLVNKRERHI